MKIKNITAKMGLVLIYPFGFVEETVGFIRRLFKHSWKNYKVHISLYNDRIKEYWGR